MNDYANITALNKIYTIPEPKDSYYKINPEQFEDTSSSSSSLDIKPRAKEFGIKLKGLVDSGEVNIYCFDVEMLIIVNVYKICNSNNETKRSILINIVFPKQRYPPRFDQIKLYETFEIADKITKGFKIGIKFPTAIILEVIIKHGISWILVGPICAAIGFCD